MKAAIIGLGAMGAGMAGNLHRAGFLSGAWNRTRTRGETVASKHGFSHSESIKDACKHADLAIISVSADQDLRDVSHQLVSILPAGTIVLDTSTVSADTAREVSQAFAEAGIAFLDGPVSGGKEGAENGTMVMMVGGEPELMQRIMPILEVITSRATHMGPVGAGQATKAVNQIMAAGILQAVSEALAFGEAQGLDMAEVIELLSGGAAGNWFLAHRGLSMTQGRFEPGFRIALHHKDLKICQAMAAKQHASLPCVEMTLVHYQRLIEAGHGDEDISALYRVKRALFESKTHRRRLCRRISTRANATPSGISTGHCWYWPARDRVRHA